MTEDQIKELEQEVKKLKRISSEWASKLHDLVEDSLPAGYMDIPDIAQGTFDACKAWADANQRLKAAQAK
jgi:hypothetical protein